MTTNKSQIYTRGGDKGETSLVGGTRIMKSCSQIDAYGNVDELNSFIGLLRSYLVDNHVQQNILFQIQNELFVLGSILATEVDKREAYKIPNLSTSLIGLIEKSIDEMDEKLPKLKNFILPGGVVASSSAHLARTVCRRVERSMVELRADKSESIAIVPDGAIELINRLSDYFFVLARFLNFENNTSDVIWKN